MTDSMASHFNNVQSLPNHLCLKYIFSTRTSLTPLVLFDAAMTTTGALLFPSPSLMPSSTVSSSIQRRSQSYWMASTLRVQPRPPTLPTQLTPLPHNLEGAMEASTKTAASRPPHHPRIQRSGLLQVTAALVASVGSRYRLRPSSSSCKGESEPLTPWTIGSELLDGPSILQVHPYSRCYL
jgi:hypothetical protein